MDNKTEIARNTGRAKKEGNNAATQVKERDLPPMEVGCWNTQSLTIGFTAHFEDKD